MPSEQFETAAKQVQNLKAKPGNDELLQTYALYKIATGATISSDRPGLFDPKGRAKYDAWKAEVDKGTSAEDAEKKYIDLVEELKTKHGYEG